MPLHNSKRRTYHDFSQMNSRQLKEELKKSYHKIGTLKYMIDTKALLAMPDCSLKRGIQLSHDIALLEVEVKECETDCDMIFRIIQEVIYREEMR